MTPDCPTANTVLPAPHTPKSGVVTPPAMALHVVPFQCRIEPPAPTANTLEAEVPHAENRSLPPLMWVQAGAVEGGGGGGGGSVGFFPPQPDATRETAASAGTSPRHDHFMFPPRGPRLAERCRRARREAAFSPVPKEPESSRPPPRPAIRS